MRQWPQCKANCSRELRRNAALLGRLLTNFSPKIRDTLLSRAAHGRLRLGGERSEVVILVSDIRGFTKLTAGMDTDDVMDLLNDYFSALVEAIFKHDGTVDKITGDAILAVFGSPEPDPLRHEKALRAAMAMQSAMAEVSEQRKRRGQVTCTIGIGVHCGEVLHGFIGSNDRMELTIIGEAANWTARYCDGAGGRRDPAQPGDASAPLALHRRRADHDRHQARRQPQRLPPQRDQEPHAELSAESLSGVLDDHGADIVPRASRERALDQAVGRGREPAFRAISPPARNRLARR